MEGLNTKKKSQLVHGLSQLHSAAQIPWEVWSLEGGRKGMGYEKPPIGQEQELESSTESSTGNPCRGSQLCSRELTTEAPTTLICPRTASPLRLPKTPRALLQLVSPTTCPQLPGATWEKKKKKTLHSCNPNSDARLGSCFLSRPESQWRYRGEKHVQAGTCADPTLAS